MDGDGRGNKDGLGDSVSAVVEASDHGTNVEEDAFERDGIDGERGCEVGDPGVFANVKCVPGGRTTTAGGEYGGNVSLRNSERKLLFLFDVDYLRHEHYASKSYRHTCTHIVL